MKENDVINGEIVNLFLSNQPSYNEISSWTEQSFLKMKIKI